MNVLHHVAFFDYAKIFEHNPFAMLAVTCEGRLLKANRQARHLLASFAGATSGSGILTNPSLLQKLAEFQIFRDLVISAYPAGRRRVFRVEGSPIRRKFRSFILLTVQDITVSNLHLKKLTYRASHDALTGALDRGTFLEKLNLSIKQASQQGLTLMVLYVDINQFKEINSVHGHAAGDAVLVHTVKTMIRIIGKKGIVCRLGGDEFAVCMHPVSSYSEISEHILRLTSSIRYMEVPFREHQIGVKASYGASMYSENGEDANAMLERGDRAMFLMKGKALFD